METNKYEVVPTADSRPPPPSSHHVTVHNDFSDNLLHPNKQPSAYCLPLQELSILVNSTLLVPAILNTGSQITVIQHDIAQSLGVPINYQQLIEMEGANGTTNWMVGCIENLTIQVGDASFKVNAHVVEHALFNLLLGCPFQQTALCWFEDLPSGKVEVSVQDPANPSQRIYLATCPRTGCAPAVTMLSVLKCVSLSLLPTLATA